MDGIVIVILLGSTLRFSKLIGICSHCPPKHSCWVGGAWVTMAIVILWHEYLVTQSFGKIIGLGFGEFEVRESVKNYLALLPVFCWTFNSYLQFKQTFAKPLPTSSISVWALLTSL